MPSSHTTPRDVTQGHNPESLVPASLPPSGLAVCAIEEFRYRLGMISQRLLLDYHAACPQPRMLGPRLRQLPTLLYKARRAGAPGLPPRPLLHRKIPYKTGMIAMTP